MTSVCGFDLSDKDSKYLIVVVKLCVENSSRARRRKRSLLLVTESRACEASLPADGRFLPGFLGRMFGRLVSTRRRHGEAGKCPSQVKMENHCLKRSLSTDFIFSHVS